MSTLGGLLETVGFVIASVVMLAVFATVIANLFMGGVYKDMTSRK